jgi:putative membrane protein
MKTTLLASACLASLALALPVRAADVSKADAKFARQAAVGGMMEVQLGEIAQKQAAATDVKEFGALMVKDHGQAGTELAGIAKTEGIKLPEKVGEKMQASMDKLAKLDGKAFDRAYVHAMVKDHTKDVAEFKEATKTLTDPALKAFAEKVLPIIEGHLEKIKAIEAAMK